MNRTNVFVKAMTECRHTNTMAFQVTGWRKSILYCVRCGALKHALDPEWRLPGLVQELKSAEAMKVRKR